MKGLRALVGLGSVSDFCVKHMPCCVCVVRPRGTVVMNRQEEAAVTEAETGADEDHKHAE